MVIKLPRSTGLNLSLFELPLKSPNLNFFLTHDGYSWQKVYFNDMFIPGAKAGSIVITRAKSPATIFEKGKIIATMKQKKTYKIKTLKAKRKK